MEKLCSRVRAEDADALEALVKPVRDRASTATRDFLHLHSNPVSQPPAAQPSSCVSSSCHADDDMDEEPVSGRQIQLLLPEIPADQNAAESWDNLEEVSISKTVAQHTVYTACFKKVIFFFKGTSRFLMNSHLVVIMSKWIKARI